jgi:uncharacterized protein YxeA
MKKRLTVIGIIIVLIAAGAGFWVWQNWQTQKRIDAYWQKKADEVNPWLTKKADEVDIKKLPTGEQIVRNNTQGYEFTVPKDWYVEKPRGGAIGLRVLPPKGAACKQAGFIKIENPEKKSPAQSFKDDLYANDIEENQYTIEPYNSKFNEAVIITTNVPGWHTKSFRFSKEGFIYSFFVVSTDSISKDCERLFFDTIKTISLF